MSIMYWKVDVKSEGNMTSFEVLILNEKIIIDNIKFKEGNKSEIKKLKDFTSKVKKNTEEADRLYQWCCDYVEYIVNNKNLI